MWIARWCHLALVSRPFQSLACLSRSVVSQPCAAAFVCAGLSYTSWSYEIVGVPAAEASLDPVRRLLRDTEILEEATAADGSSRGSVGGGWRTEKVTFPSLEAARDKATAPVKYVVKVSNVGSVDADDVLLGFLEPPGAGVNGVPLQVLFGFERVHIKAGESAVVTIYPSLTDFTHVTLEGQRVPLAGHYSVRFGLKETRALGQGYAEHTLTMKTDDDDETLMICRGATEQRCSSSSGNSSSTSSRSRQQYDSRAVFVAAAPAVSLQLEYHGRRDARGHEH
jgi:hypothetical protein